jgi:predicted nuclease with TOPRIM domain
MTTERWTEEMLDKLAEKVDKLAEKLDRQSEKLDQQSENLDRQSEDLKKESDKWDERFYQSSRDTLNFSRNIIVTAAVVAVLAPLLRESLSIALELLLRK